MAGSLVGEVAWEEDGGDGRHKASASSSFLPLTCLS